MNTKTDILEKYVNLVDPTKKQNTYLTKIIVLFEVILSLFQFFFSLII